MPKQLTLFVEKERTEPRPTKTRRRRHSKAPSGYHCQAALMNRPARCDDICKGLEKCQQQACFARELAELGAER